MTITGIEAALEVLSASDVRYIFGNPGTTELPLNEALVTDKRFQYILGLSEVPMIAMADGYAMASGKAAVANVHISCGLGNAMGMLYNAYREGTPLLLTAGQQDRRLIFEEPILAGDLVGVTSPWTKWSHEVQRVEDVPQAIRRALQTALTPPTGPVFLSLPIDVQMEACDGLDLSGARLANHHVRPPVDALNAAAKLLASAERPVILAGSGVTEAGAVAALVEVAEAIGAPVIAESATTHGRLGFPCDHPLSARGLTPWSNEVHDRLEQHDVMLVVGMDLLQQYIYCEPSNPIPKHIKLVHLDEDPWQIGKNYHTEVGLIGDTKVGLEELGPMIRSAMTSDQTEAAIARVARYRDEHEANRANLREEIAGENAHRPLTPLTMMNAIARVIPDDIAVVEEAVTTTGTTLERLGALKNTSGYFAHRGWALGWGLGCALGVKLAWPERQVLGIVGDGASIYGIQGLWSAAHHQIGATIIVPNNTQYQILKLCCEKLPLPQAAKGNYEALDMVSPEVDFVGLAKSFGVEAVRVEDPDELSDRLKVAFSDDKPRLIEVPVQPEAK